MDAPTQEDTSVDLEIGSPQWAACAGRLGHPACAVRLAQSTLPGAGRGVFVTLDLPDGAWVTPYSGRDLSMEGTKYPDRDFDAETELSPLELDYALDAPSKCGGRTRVGVSRPGLGDGVAQLCNDAIHEHVTGQRNNCEFDWHGGEPYLRTTRPVSAGEELLVEYHISYWLHPSRWGGLPVGTRQWLECVASLQEILQASGWELEEYMYSNPDEDDTDFARHIVRVSRADGSSSSNHRSRVRAVRMPVQVPARATDLVDAGLVNLLLMHE